MSGSSPTKARRWPPSSAGCSRPSAATGRRPRCPSSYLARLQGAFGAAAGGADRTDPPAGLVEQLTRRELEVLGMLATGQSNHDIARDLVISLDTVKKHVTHLLAKLGAVNRTEAVARGRELGLIGR